MKSKYNLEKTISNLEKETINTFVKELRKENKEVLNRLFYLKYSNKDKCEIDFLIIKENIDEIIKQNLLLKEKRNVRHIKYLGLAIIGLALLGIAIAGDAGAIAGTVSAYLKSLSRNPSVELKTKKQWVQIKDVDEDGNEIPLEADEEPEYELQKVRNNVKNHPFMNGFIAGITIESVVECFLIGLTVWLACGIA